MLGITMHFGCGDHDTQCPPPFWKSLQATEGILANVPAQILLRILMDTDLPLETIKLLAKTFVYDQVTW